MILRSYHTDRRSAHRLLRIEPLEKRTLLAVVLDVDVLRIDGTTGDDVATVTGYTQDSEYWLAVTLNAQTDHFLAADVRKIVFRGDYGDDYFRNDSSEVCYAYGNPGADTLIGGSAGDSLIGGTQNNLLYGRGGDDRLYGLSGAEEFYGGDGNDSLYGNTGYDSLYGEAGDDLIRGSSGSDLLDGGEGNDTIRGQTGYDTIYGQGGNDLIHGDANDDTIYGGDGDDYLYGGAQNDNLYGEAGKDRLFGVYGSNTLYGGAGGDGLYGAEGGDLIYGDDGGDLIRGYEGNDTLVGGDQNDRVYGGDGQDSLSGGVGDDKLYGEAGDDTLRGEAGADELYGGADDDNLLGGADADSLFGEAGDDGLFGGVAATDALEGGDGSDRFLTHDADSVADLNYEDAEVLFVDGTSPYTVTPKDWTDADVERVDVALVQLHQRAGTARILRETLTSGPVKMYIAEEFDGGYIGFNWFTGYDRQIHVLDDLSDHWFEAAIIHEFGHNWDSSGEGNPYWDGFSQLHDQSQNSNDFTRSYGSTNAKEDWATNWEVEFGYCLAYYPASPSSLLLQKEAIVDSFFDNFTTFG